MRLCTDCRHSEFGMDGMECQRPLSDARSPVNGKHCDRLIEVLCWNERKPGKTLLTRRERCGPAGQFFEAKP